MWNQDLKAFPNPEDKGAKVDDFDKGGPGRMLAVISKNSVFRRMNESTSRQLGLRHASGSYLFRPARQFVIAVIGELL
jgi:hypothetical protein